MNEEQASQHQPDHGRRARQGIHAAEWGRGKNTRLRRRISHRASDGEDYEACLTELMTKFKVRRRSDLDTAEAGEARSDPPTDVAMEMAAQATSIAAETVGVTSFQRIE